MNLVCSGFRGPQYDRWNDSPKSNFGYLIKLCLPLLMGSLIKVLLPVEYTGNAGRDRYKARCCRALVRSALGLTD